MIIRCVVASLREAGLLVVPLVCFLLTFLSTLHAAEEQTCKDTIVAATPDANFILHNDGTATHKTTGLVWMRCSLGQTWEGETCSGPAEGFSWADALRFVVLLWIHQMFGGAFSLVLP